MPQSNPNPLHYTEARQKIKANANTIFNMLALLEICHADKIRLDAATLEEMQHVLDTKQDNIRVILAAFVDRLQTPSTQEQLKIINR